MRRVWPVRVLEGPSVIRLVDWLLLSGESRLGEEAGRCAADLALADQGLDGLIATLLAIDRVVPADRDELLEISDLAACRFQASAGDDELIDLHEVDPCAARRLN